MRHSTDIKEVERYYTITEDGMVWSKNKGRWMKPQVNMSGYVFYFINFGVDKPRWIFAHTLVALKYVGMPPTTRHEIDHIDNNRQNNHYTNLRWVTHSENSLKALSGNHVSWWTGKHKAPHTLETRIKMSNAKKKKIEFITFSGRKVYDSIDDAARDLGTYRKRIYLCIKNDAPFAGGHLSVISDD